MNTPDTPDWLKPARAEFARLQPDAAQDAALLATLTRQLQARHVQPDEPRWPRRLAWGSGALGMAAALLLSVVLLLDPPGGHATPAAADSSFIALVPESELRGATVWLQPAELPRERLALLGLPFDATRADELVRAELMLNPNGQLLAVRLLD